MRRLVARLFLALLVLVGIAGGGGYLYLRQSLPDYDADANVHGINADIDIVRDVDGIPHIFAGSRADGLFGRLLQRGESLGGDWSCELCDDPACEHASRSATRQARQP